MISVVTFAENLIRLSFKNHVSDMGWLGLSQAYSDPMMQCLQQARTHGWSRGSGPTLLKPLLIFVDNISNPAAWEVPFPAIQELFRQKIPRSA